MINNQNLQRSGVFTLNSVRNAAFGDDAFYVEMVVFDQGFEEFSREELLKNLHSALTEALVMNREEAQQAAGDDFEEVRISA